MQRTSWNRRAFIWRSIQTPQHATRFALLPRDIHVHPPPHTHLIKIEKAPRVPHLTSSKLMMTVLNSGEKQTGAQAARPRTAQNTRAERTRILYKGKP